eukprot:750713-Hanusia_phi.AAC.3
MKFLLQIIISTQGSRCWRNREELMLQQIRAASCVDCEKVWSVFKKHCVRNVVRAARTGRALRSTAVNFDHAVRMSRDVPATSDVCVMSPDGGRGRG